MRFEAKKVAEMVSTVNSVYSIVKTKRVSVFSLFRHEEINQ